MMTKEDIDALRFNVPRKSGAPLKDAFIDAIMQMFFIRNNMEHSLFGFGLKRDMKKVAEQLGLTKCAGAAEEEKRLFIDAYRDTAALFIKLSEKDKAYATGLLNLSMMSDDKFRRKVKGDFESLGTAMPQRVGMEELFAPFAQGLDEAYNAFFKEKEGQCPEDR